MTQIFPNCLAALHKQEEELRIKALHIATINSHIQLHLNVIYNAMDLAASFILIGEENDEDFKVIQMLSIRVFNAFGSSLKLALSGYIQNSAMIMRDILETIFLIDFFSTDQGLIKAWRHADRKEMKKKFSPVKVRECLDERDGFTTKRRADVYNMFCELAAHPNMNSVHMLRPEKEGDIVLGPYVESTSLKATLDEMGKLAVQFGAKLSFFFPKDCEIGIENRLAFIEASQIWIRTFYPNQKTI